MPILLFFAGLPDGLPVFVAIVWFPISDALALSDATVWSDLRLRPRCAGIADDLISLVTVEEAGIKAPLRMRARRGRIWLELQVVLDKKSRDDQWLGPGWTDDAQSKQMLLSRTLGLVARGPCATLALASPKSTWQAPG